MDLGLRLNYRPVFTKAHMLKLAGIVTAVFFFFLHLYKRLSRSSGFEFHANRRTMGGHRQMRQQIARDHEIQSGNIVNGTASNGLEAGDLLDLAGDETFLAAQNYQLASQQWTKQRPVHIGGCVR